MPRVSPRDGRAAWGRTRREAGQAADDRRPGPDRAARSPHLLASPLGSGRRRGRHDHAAPTGPAPPRARQKAGRCLRPAWTDRSDGCGGWPWPSTPAVPRRRAGGPGRTEGPGAGGDAWPCSSPGAARRGQPTTQS